MSFTAALAVLLVCWLSQEAGADTVGIIITNNETFHERAHDAFVSQLAMRGYKDRLKFIVQRPHPDPIAWSNAARKLIAADVDVIVTYGARATLAAVKEKSDIPIVFADVFENAAVEIKPAYATGVCYKYSVSSLLRYLRGFSSGTNIGVLYSTQEEDSSYQLAEIEKLSEKYDMKVAPLNVRNPLDTTGMVSGVNVNFLVVTSSSTLRGVFSTIMRVANGKGIPVVSLMYHTEQQPMIMLSAIPEEHGREAAEKLIRILEGSRVEDIERTCTKDIVLVFNAKEARNMGIRIPMDLVTEATRVIY